MAEIKESRFSPFLKQCYVTSSIIVSTIGHGCGVGFIGILAPQVNQPGAALSLTPDAVSWLASMSGPTMLVGNLMLVPIMSKSGRRSAMCVVLIMSILGWFCQILATSFEVLLIGRIVQGLSLGMILSLRAIMCGEYTTPKYRGAFLAAIGVGQTFGVFLVHLLGTFLPWRLTGLFVTFFFFISLVMILFSPESPSFLASKGRYDECREAFRWLRGKEEEPELDKLIKACLITEKNKIEAETMRPPGFRQKLEIYKKPELYKPVILMTHMYFLAQFSGSNLLACYPTQIIGGLMGPGASVGFWMLFLDVQRLLMNIVAIFIINKLKRRTVLFSMAALSIFAHAVIALYVFAKSYDKLFYDAAWIPILLINLQVVSIAIGLIPIPSVVGGEVFPLQYRSICSSISFVSVSITMFISLKTFPNLIEAAGLHGTYLMYALILLYNTVVIWFLMPETKGRTLQDIEDEFRGRPLVPDEIKETDPLQNKEFNNSKLSLRKASVQS